MQRARMLMTPRWLLLALAVVAVVLVFLRLSEWQLDRLEERRSANALIVTNQRAAPVPVARLLDTDRPVRADFEWRRVTATGRYDTRYELLVRYRHLGGEPGFHVLTPLITTDGATVLVDRGWVPQGGNATRPPRVSAPPDGVVTVTGRVRPSEDGNDDQTRPETGQIRYIDVPLLVDWLPYPVYRGYVELTDQDPASSDGSGAEPVPVPPPELDEGPHLSYAVQWVIFAIIAVGGVGFLAYDAVRGGRLRERLRAREFGRGAAAHAEDGTLTDGPTVRQPTEHQTGEHQRGEHQTGDHELAERGSASKERTTDRESTG